MLNIWIEIGRSVTRSLDITPPLCCSAAANLVGRPVEMQQLDLQAMAVTELQELREALTLDLLMEPSALALTEAPMGWLLVVRHQRNQLDQLANLSHQVSNQSRSSFFANYAMLCCFHQLCKWRINCVQLDTRVVDSSQL